MAVFGASGGGDIGMMRIQMMFEGRQLPATHAGYFGGLYKIFFILYFLLITLLYRNIR